MLVRVRPAGFEADVTLPRRALERRSPAATWKAELADVKPNDFFPVESVTTVARTPAFLKAVACCEEAAPAESMAALMLVAKLSTLVTPDRLTATLIRSPSLKPGPLKKKSVDPPTANEPALVESETIAWTLVEADPAPMSIDETP